MHSHLLLKPKRPAPNLRAVWLLYLTSMSLCALAQEDKPSQTQELQELPEEVIVTGTHSAGQLRMQMWEAEKAAYDIFNMLNDEKRFNISCRMHQPTGTRIERQICQAQFELDATRAHGQDYLESLRDEIGFGGVPNSSPRRYVPVEAAIASQLREYREKIKKVAEDHPEFLEAIIKYSEKREQYEKEIRTTPE